MINVRSDSILASVILCVIHRHIFSFSTTMSAKSFMIVKEVMPSTALNGSSHSNIGLDEQIPRNSVNLCFCPTLN